MGSDTSLHDQMKAQQELELRLKRLTFGDENKADDHTAADVHASEFDLSYQRAKGTPVNKKTFAVWAKQFVAAYRKERAEMFAKRFGNDDKRDKLTGVQIFELKAQEKLGIEVGSHKKEEEEEEKEEKEVKEEVVKKKEKKRKKKKKGKEKGKTVVVSEKKKAKEFKNDE